MRKLLATFVFILGSGAMATEDAQIDLAKDAATILEFQSAIALYDESKAMSFLAPEAELIFKVGEHPSQKFSGIEQIREAYSKFWFKIPSKMLDLREANFSRLSGNKFKYVFRGEFSIKDGDEWRLAKRESVSLFTVENGKIVKIERFQEASQN